MKILTKKAMRDDKSTVNFSRNEAQMFFFLLIFLFFEFNVNADIWTSNRQ